jgi:hypothetical protein
MGNGIEGDRHFGKRKVPGENLTLVEAEELEAFAEERGVPVDLSQSRRNIVTRGVRLNDLVGKEFRLGTALLRGVELCEPCSVMGRLYAQPDWPGSRTSGANMGMSATPRWSATTTGSSPPSSARCSTGSDAVTGSPTPSMRGLSNAPRCSP